MAALRPTPLRGARGMRLAAQALLAGAVNANSDELNLAEAFRDGLKQQAISALETQGESITIMAVGESGLGKTSLMASLFRSELVWPEAPKGQPTVRIAEQTVTFDLEGVPFAAHLIDTPGYGDMEPQREFNVVLGRINHGFRRMLVQERRLRRPAKPRHDEPTGVDVVLYYFAPHRCKRPTSPFCGSSAARCRSCRSWRRRTR